MPDRVALFDQAGTGPAVPPQLAQHDQKSSLREGHVKCYAVGQEPSLVVLLASGHGAAALASRAKGARDGLPRLKVFELSMLPPHPLVTLASRVA